MKQFNHFPLRLALIAALSLCSLEGFAEKCTTWYKVRLRIAQNYNNIDFRPSSGENDASETLTIPANRTIWLSSNTTIYYTNIVVEDGATLNLSGTWSGHKQAGYANKTVVTVQKGGTLNLYGTICEAYKNGAGAAIYNSGTVNMKPGSHIYNCSANNSIGGAVYNEGTFTMEGQENYPSVIGNCGHNLYWTSYWTNDGGAVFNTATFTMANNSYITGCDISGKGGGVYNSGTFTLKDQAYIQNCYNFGVYNVGTFNMQGTSKIQNCGDGGVYSSGTTNINGGDSRCWIQNCHHNYGGGLEVTAGTTTVANCNIYANTGHMGTQACCHGTGTLILNSGANLDAGKVTGGNTGARGALFIENSNAKITMNDGSNVKNSISLSGWPGAGVTVYSGTFEMKGGWIGDNTASTVGGGIYVISGGVVNISGGEIKSNSATNGGGIYSERPVTISGGKIHDNTASGGGGGVFVQSETMILSGGEIYNNSAQYGGGVRCTGGTTTLSGTKIYSNKAYGNGDGVQLHGNLTFNMTGGEIYGNYDYNGVQYGGGGILAWENVTLNISGGKIYNNTTSGNGGAIHMGQNSKVTITGGKIYGNKSGGNSTYAGSGTPSGGIFYNSSDSLMLGDSAKVYRNFKSDGTTASNIYIPKDKIITITSALTDTIGITTATKPTTSAAVEFSGMCNESDTVYFRSDNSIYKMERNASNNLELCGYKLTYYPNHDDATQGYVRTINGQACPALPVLSKTGMYSPGWYTENQTAEGDAIPSSDKKVVPGATVDFSEDRTVYAWWKDICKQDTTDIAGAKETISKETVTNEDVLYTLNQVVENEKINNITVFNMSKSDTIASPSEVIDMIRNCPKSTPNTLIYVPEGTEVPLDRSENVVATKINGADTSYTCTNFSVTDGSPIKVEHTFTADAATYTRLNSSRWGTICVPFELKSDDHIQYYTSGTKYGSGENTSLVLSKADTVTAGTPAIYCVSGIEGSNKGDINITNYDRSVLKAAGVSGTIETIKLVGTFTELEIDDAKAASISTDCDIYYYLDNAFYKRSSNQTVTIPALRAYILIQKAQQ